MSFCAPACNKGGLALRVGGARGRRPCGVYLSTASGSSRKPLDGSGYSWLDSSKGVMIAVVLHELATNALKHGALSNGTGQINISWDRKAEPDLVKLVWRESGGPKVAPPKNGGFGSHLI